MRTTTAALASGVIGLEIAFAACGDALPVETAGRWQVRLGTGRAALPNGAVVRVDAPVVFDVPPPPVEEVRDERCARMPLFNPKTGGWRRGYRLLKLRTQECSATGLLFPESLRVKAGPGPDAHAFEKGKDFLTDDFWATVGRTPEGGIGPAQPVWIDYRYSPCRLDSIVLRRDGTPAYIEGKPAVGVILPPDIPEGAVRVANVWVPGRTEQLTEENLYPIDFETLRPLPVQRPAPAERLLPRTLERLRTGRRVTIVAWGDSVTNGGGVGASKDLWYQNQFVERLRKRFPEADIVLYTAAWPGGNSRGWLNAPPGGKYDFKRDVLDRKPDLVTIEFVNDAWMNEEQTVRHYNKILDIFARIGAEVILITPHFVRLDWMHVKTMKLDDDPRPYVHGLRRVARERNVALADASRLWCRLKRQGIPYITLEANSINHPDARGHRLFADALMALFPDK